MGSGKVPRPGLNGEVLGWVLGRISRLRRAPRARSYAKGAGKGVPALPSRYLTLRVAGRSKRSGRGPGAESGNLLFERAGVSGSPGFSREGQGEAEGGRPAQGGGRGEGGPFAGSDPQDRGWDRGGGVPRRQGSGESQSPPAPGPPSPGGDGSGKGLRTHTPEGMLTSRRGHSQRHWGLELRPGAWFELAGGGAADPLNSGRSGARACGAAVLHLERGAEARAAGRLRRLILTVDYIFGEDSVVCPFTCLICN